MLFSRPGVGSTFVVWLPDRALSQLGSTSTADHSTQPPTINPVTR